MKKVCVVTGTRAEYGILFNLLKEIEKSNALDLFLAVTGSHLSSDFGLTYKEIEKDFKIDKKIDINLSSDSVISINNSMALAQSSFAKLFEEIQPDIVVLLGDRYEVLSVAIAAMMCRIPIAHLHGGETTEGAVDEAIRHSITKMSHFHFVSNSELFLANRNK